LPATYYISLLKTLIAGNYLLLTIVDLVSPRGLR